MKIKNLAARLGLAVAIVIAGSGCATNSVSELYEFYPLETNTDSKLFEYRFILDPAQRMPGSRQATVPPGFSVSFSDMRAELENYMEVYPYCTDGYFVFEESFDGQRYILRGECQESK